MNLSEDATSLIDVADDAHSMVDRLKILEHLLLDCICDMQAAEPRSAGDAMDGYDGNEMLFFLDEPLSRFIQECQNQISMCTIP